MVTSCSGTELVEAVVGRFWTGDPDGTACRGRPHNLFIPVSPRLDGVAGSPRAVPCIILISTFTLQTDENRPNLVIDDTTGHDALEFRHLPEWRNAVLAVETHQIPHPTPSPRARVDFEFPCSYSQYLDCRLYYIIVGTRKFPRPGSITSPSTRHNLSNRRLPLHQCYLLPTALILLTTSGESVPRLFFTDGSRSRENGGEYLAQMRDIMTEDSRSLEKSEVPSECECEGSNAQFAMAPMKEQVMRRDATL